MKKIEKVGMVVAVLLLIAAFAWASSGRETEEPADAIAPSGGMYNEAPMLAAMVAAGELRPVDERLPTDVMVITPIERVGQYGGTIRAFATDADCWQDLNSGAGLSEGLFRMTKDGSGAEPNLATGYVMSDDFMTFTYFLREGVKWSDGDDLTAEDSIFWFEDFLLDPAITSWSQLYPADLDSVEALDEYTVVLNLNTPHPDLMAIMAQFPSWLMYQPLHYLGQWHPKHNPGAEALAEEEGFATWQQALNWHSAVGPRQLDLNLPQADAFVLKESTTTHYLYERNPFYWKVDTAGNQLPYVDYLHLGIVDAETYQLKIVTGESDYAYLQTTFANYTLYKENEESGDYRTVLLPGPYASDMSIVLNQNYPDNDIRHIFQDKRFRQALSIAIDREEINNAVYLGQGVPRQATILPSASYYREEWGTAWAQYDPALANRMLDQIGLTEKDRSGIRLTPDGQPLVIIVNINVEGAAATYTKILELITEFWADVGIGLLIKPLEQGLYMEQSRDYHGHMARAGYTPRVSEIINYTQGDRDFAERGDWLNGWTVWDTWRAATDEIERLTGLIAEETDADKIAELEAERERHQTTLDVAIENLYGDPEPVDLLELQHWFDERAQVPMGSPRYMELSRMIYDFHAEEVWIIGTVGMVPLPIIYANNLRNGIDGTFINRSILPKGTTDYFDQLFFD